MARQVLDIISVGNNTLDIFAHTDQAKLLKSGDSTKQFLSYPVGSKLLVTELRRSFGGNGANAAVNLAGLGLKTGYVGSVGNDATGDSILSELKKRKVSFLGARSSSSATSIVLDAMGEDRTILTYKGDNNFLEKKHLDFKKIKAKAFYITIMLGKSLDTLRAVVSQARKDNSFIAFNPDQNLIEKEKAVVEEIVSKSSLVVLNKDEAVLLTGFQDIASALKEIHYKGPKTVVITDGKNGAVALHEGFFYMIFPRKGLKVVETTGAGDAFASTLAAGFVIGKPIDFCLKMAMNQSESVIQGHGAQNHLLNGKQLLAAASKDKRAVTRQRA